MSTHMTPEQKQKLDDAFRAYERTLGSTIEALYNIKRVVDGTLQAVLQDRVLARAQRDMALAMLSPEGGAPGHSASAQGTLEKHE